MFIRKTKEPGPGSTLAISRPVAHYPNGPAASPQYLRSPSQYLEISPGLSSAFEHTPFKRSFAEAEMEEGYKKKPSKAEVAVDQYLAGAKLVAIVVVLCVVAFLVMLSGGIVATWTFLAFLTVFELGSALCGGAQSSAMLIAGRAVAGIGGAGLTNGGLVIVTRVAPPKKRPLFISLIMSMVALGQLLAPLIGGPLTQNTSWRWCFLLNIPIGVVVALVVLIIGVSDARPKAMQKLGIFQRISRNLDLVGFALFSIACVTLIMPLQWGGAAYPWVSAEVILPLIASFMTFSVFIAWQHTKGDAALIRFSLLKKREVWSSCLVTAFSRGAMFVHVYYLPLWFQLVQQASPIMSGVDNLPSFIAQIVISVVAGRLVSKFGYYTLLSIIGSAINTVGAGLMTTFTPSTSTGMWIGYQIITGFGRGMIMQMPLSAVSNVLPQKELTTGLSLVTFSQFFGGTIFVAVAQSVFNNELPLTLHQYAPALGNGANGGGSTIQTGAIPPAILPGLLMAYNNAIIYTFYLAMAGAACAFLSSWGMGFHKMRPPPKDEAKLKEGEKPAVQVPDDTATKAAKTPAMLVLEGTASRSNAWRKQSLILETL
ncbi:hypothetical protein MMC11_003660 [Xylographa trunciseda]|nr:hypothetical protein [Xylographa trunciseda]